MDVAILFSAQPLQTRPRIADKANAQLLEEIEARCRGFPQAAVDPAWQRPRGPWTDNGRQFRLARREI